MQLFKNINIEISLFLYIYTYIYYLYSLLFDDIMNEIINKKNNLLNHIEEIQNS